MGCALRLRALHPVCAGGLTAPVGPQVKALPYSQYLSVLACDPSGAVAVAGGSHMGRTRVRVLSLCRGAQRVRLDDRDESGGE
jgi:hypothetical protein